MEDGAPGMIRFWKTYYWQIHIALAVTLWLVYSYLGPGHDYFGAYTWMVMKPELYPANADYPWTLNPPWMVPFMAPFIGLPGKMGYILFMAATLGVVLVGARHFGGKPWLALLSAQLFWVLWWGQLEGWGILALVLGWLAMEKEDWRLMSLALLMAAFKPQVGFIPVAVLWFWSGKARLKSLAVLVGVFIWSLFTWGPWLTWYAEGTLKFIGDEHFHPWNASLGLVALPLYLPAVLLPMSRRKRLLALTATTLLASPYLPYYSTILLLCFNIPAWTVVFVLSGYFPYELGTGLAWNSVVLLPVTVLIWLYWQPTRKVLAAWLARRKANPVSISGVTGND